MAKQKKGTVRTPRGNYRPQKGGDTFSTFSIDAEPSSVRLLDSTHVWVCPICEQRLYVDGSCAAQIDSIQKVIDAFGPTSIEIAGPACEKCYAVMEVHRLY